MEPPPPPIAAEDGDLVAPDEYSVPKIFLKMLSTARWASSRATAVVC